MAGPLILYDHVDSTNALKVRFLLDELGVAADRREVPLDGPRPAEYRQLHPFGLIPTLQDGDLVITESNVALRYLAERAGRDDLRGDSPARRARIDGLLDTLSLEVRPALWGLEEPVLHSSTLTADDEVERRTTLIAVLDAYDTLLDDAGPYAAGAFSIADCAIAARGLHLPALGLPAAVAPRLRRSVAAAQARPAFTRALG